MDTNDRRGQSAPINRFKLHADDQEGRFFNEERTKKLFFDADLKQQWKICNKKHSKKKIRESFNFMSNRMKF